LERVEAWPLTKLIVLVKIIGGPRPLPPPPPHASALGLQSNLLSKGWCMVIMAAATTDIAPTEINPHLVFNPQKNQFKFEQ